MVEAARQCASHPHEVKYQDNLRKTAEVLRDVTIVAATTPAFRAKLVDRVQVNIVCKIFYRYLQANSFI